LSYGKLVEVPTGFTFFVGNMMEYGYPMIPPSSELLPPFTTSLPLLDRKRCRAAVTKTLGESLSRLAA